MKSLVQEKRKAILLRRSGKTYKEIQEQVPVSKSSLSLWLNDLPLSEKEKKYLKKRKDKNISLGRIRAASSNHENRLLRDEKLRKVVEKDYDLFIGEPLFEVGLSLYWAEGSKRNEAFQFMNSDPELISTLICWIEKYFKIPRSKLYFRLYLHKPFLQEGCEEYWAQKLGVTLSQFKKTILKPTSLLVKKRPNYKGCLRIEIHSVIYFRTMIFWLEKFKTRYK
jgi:transposase